MISEADIQERKAEALKRNLWFRYFISILFLLPQVHIMKKSTMMRGSGWTVVFFEELQFELTIFNPDGYIDYLVRLPNNYWIFSGRSQPTSCSIWEPENI